MRHPCRASPGRPLPLLQLLPLPFPLRFLQTLISAMATGVDSPTLDDDTQYGFQRPEMNQTALAGTVDPYDAHLFLCYKSPESWPARAEGPDADLLPRFLAAALKSRKVDIPRNVRFTLSEGREGTHFSDGDILLFPDMIRYSGLAHADVDAFIEAVLVKGNHWASGSSTTLSGSYVFVCAHGSRDRRCGVCGPVLVKKFEEEIELRGLKDAVLVSPCSHVGGHKYAGNVIVFSPSPEGKIMGHWYGYVTPDDVSVLLDQHIEKGEIVERLWRGQMGSAGEGQKKAHKQKVQENGGEVSTEGTTVAEGKKEMKEDKSGGRTAASCCQGANGVSCCMVEKNEATSSDTVGTGGKYLNGVKTWLKSWDQADAFMAAGVVTALASVAVAYSIYRRPD